MLAVSNAKNDVSLLSYYMIKPSVQLKIKKPLTLLISPSLPEIRRKNIQVLCKDVQYIKDDQLYRLEELLHEKACEKARVLGIPIDYTDIRFTNLYNSIMRHYRINLNKDSYVQNQYLEREISAGRLTISDIAEMGAMELHHDRWKDYIRVEEAEFNVILNGGDGCMEHDTLLYKCGRCKGCNCAYREEQSRSMDEGSTHRIRCKDCGNRWNHYN
jgi:DNA-directed RNA polymerase subunit M/transcription elongation factor TFIIS